MIYLNNCWVAVKQQSLNHSLFNKENVKYLFVGVQMCTKDLYFKLQRTGLIPPTCKNTWEWNAV